MAIFYKLKTELNLQQVLQLQQMLGRLNNMSDLYQECLNITDNYGIKEPNFLNYMDTGFLDNIRFQRDCLIAVKRTRGITTIDGVVYYADDVKEALSKLEHAE